MKNSRSFSASSSSAEPTVWRNGQFVEEKHLTASGKPEPEPEPEPGVGWSLLEGTEQAGIEVRWIDGKKYYRAVARLLDDRYPGKQGPLYSKEYQACDQADVQQVDAWNHINPQKVQSERSIAAAVARSHMNVDTHAAMSDMRMRLRELVADLEYPYHLWQVAQDRHRERLQSTLWLRDAIDILCTDIRTHGMCAEYERFVDQLNRLLCNQITPDA